MTDPSITVHVRSGDGWSQERAIARVSAARGTMLREEFIDPVGLSADALAKPVAVSPPSGSSPPAQWGDVRIVHQDPLMTRAYAR